MPKGDKDTTPVDDEEKQIEEDQAKKKAELEGLKPAENLTKTIDPNTGLSIDVPVAKVSIVHPASSGEAPFKSQHTPPENIKQWIDKYASPKEREYFYNLTYHESKFNPQAYNKGSKASGLGQFIPSTAANYGLTDPFNPDQNARALVELTKDNRSSLRSYLGREPTDTELVMAHQQGAGGAQQIMSGNITPKLATNLRNNNIDPKGTPAQIIQQVAAFYQTNQKPQPLPNSPERLENDFLDPRSVTTNAPILSGGLPLTKQDQARFTTLFNPKSVADIPDLARQQDAITQRVTNTPGGAARRSIPSVGTSREKVQAEGELPVPVRQAPTLPIPDWTPTEGQKLVTDLKNPSVLSTIVNAMSQFDDAEALRKSKQTWLEALQEKSDKLDEKYGYPKDRMDFGAMGPAFMRQLVDMDQAAQDTLKNTPDIAKGFLAGLTQMPANNLGGRIMPAAAIIASQYGFGSAGRYIWDLGKSAQQKSEELAHATVGAPATGQGRFSEALGRNFSGGGIGGLAAMGIGAGMEYAMPHLVPWLAKKFPGLPDVVGNLSPITPAYGATTTVQTANGEQDVDADTMKVMGWAGIITAGVLVGAPGLYRWTKNGFLYRWDWSQKYADPVREVASTGGPGQATMAVSTMSDYLKANTISAPSAEKDIYTKMKENADRQKVRQSFIATGASGINPVAAETVAQKLDMYTGGQVKNTIDNALNNGKINTPDVKFSVTHTVKQLSDFAKKVPEFAEYIRLHLIKDELQHNFVKASGLTAAQQKTSNLRQKVYDVIGKREYALNDVQVAIASLEQGPTGHAIKQNYYGYLENLRETQRVVSSGKLAAEDGGRLNAAAIAKPNTPIFSVGDGKTGIQDAITEAGGRLNRILGGDDPLFVLEGDMRAAIKQRMQNEARWTYMDDVGHGPQSPFFTQRTAEWVKGREESISDAHFTIKRGGKTYHYTTDPMLNGMWKFDPAWAGQWGAMFESTKRLFQSNTTGIFAPYFMFTAAWNTWRQQLLTAPAGSSPVWTPAFLVTEPVRQLYERKLAAAWGPALNDLNKYLQGTAVGRVMGPATTAMANVMMRHQADNFYKRMEASGGVSQGWIMNAEEYVRNINKQQRQISNPHLNAILGHFAERAKMMGKAVGSGYVETNRAIAESAQWAWARKNQNMIDQTTGQPIHPAALAAKMQRLTGNPLERGRGSWSKDGGSGRYLPFESHTATSRATRKAVRFLGQANDLYRTATPWSGVIVQSPVATMNAYMENPIKFAGLAAFTIALPETVSVLWNHYWDTDENGEKIGVLDYMYDQRSESQKRGNTYFYIPGLRPWQGLELRNYQEAAPLAEMVRIFWDHALGRNTFTLKSDIWNALNGLVDTNFKPALPPLAGMLLGGMNVTLPGGIGGKAFAGKEGGFEELGARDNAFERMIRNVMPDVADISAQFQAGFSGATSWPEGVGAGLKQVGDRLISRTTIVRDFVGKDYKQQPSGNTRVSEALYENREFFKKAYTFFNAQTNHDNTMNRKTGSKAGMIAIAPEFGDLMLPGQGGRAAYTGVRPRAPTNELWNISMKLMEKAFQKDSPAKGGAGFKSMWGIYGQYSQALESMRTVNYGNEQTWLKEQAEENPKDIEYMKSYGVDTNSFKDVKAFYTTQRTEVAKRMLKYIEEVEETIGELPVIQSMLPEGKKFRIKDVHPYGTGMKPPANPEDRGPEE